MFDHEVPVEQDALGVGQQREVAVDVVPARLDHADAGVREERHGPLQEIRRRKKVGIEDRDELAPGDLHPRLQRAGLEAGSVCAVQMDDVDALRPKSIDDLACDRLRLQ